MEKEKKKRIQRFLDFIEKGGNKLPHPLTLFWIFCLVIAIISAIAASSGASITYEAFDKKEGVIKETTLVIKSLLDAEGIRYIFSSMVKNFTGFAPLGTVLVALIGIGVAEGSGLMGATMKKVVTATPKKALTAIVVLAGVMSNIASDAGYVVLIPLGAVVFLTFGRHPIAGLAAAFAGVSGGFSANLLLSTTDPLLSGITTEAAKLLRPDYFVNPASNYYFMAASTFLITILGTFVTEKIVEPRLGEYKGEIKVDHNELTNQEKKALRWAGISLVIFCIVIGIMAFPKNGILRVDGELKQWTHDGLVPTLMLFFLIPGIVYGKVSGTIKNDKDVAKMMGSSLATMGGYLALAFAASQFVAYFSYTHLGTYVAVKGADILQSIGLTGIPLVILFVLVSAFINLFMGSASAKWAIMAPVFVPMLMQLGYSPEFTQLAYRVGDSSTNIITPLMTYFAMIVAFMQKYDKESGMGTLISVMLPYSITFLIGWTLFLVIWFVSGFPIGVDGVIHLIGA